MIRTANRTNRCKHLLFESLFRESELFSSPTESLSSFCARSGAARRRDVLPKISNPRYSDGCGEDYGGGSEPIRSDSGKPLCSKSAMRINQILRQQNKGAESKPANVRQPAEAVCRRASQPARGRQTKTAGWTAVTDSGRAVQQKFLKASTKLEAQNSWGGSQYDRRVDRRAALTAGAFLKAAASLLDGNDSFLWTYCVWR